MFTRAREIKQLMPEDAVYNPEMDDIQADPFYDKELEHDMELGVDLLDFCIDQAERDLSDDEMDWDELQVCSKFV